MKDISASRNYTVGVLVQDASNPLAVGGTPAGLSVTVCLSDTEGGPAIDASLEFAAAAQTAPPPGYSGAYFIAQIDHAVTAPFLDDRIGFTVWRSTWNGNELLDQPEELRVTP